MSNRNPDFIAAHVGTGPEAKAIVKARGYVALAERQAELYPEWTGPGSADNREPPTDRKSVIPWKPVLVVLALAAAGAVVVAVASD